MRRRLLAGVVAVVALVALTGCKIKIDVSTTVNADESGTVSVALLFDEEFLRTLTGLGAAFEDFGEDLPVDESDTPDPLDEMIADAPKGWEAERHREGDLQGVRMTTDFSSLAELEARLAESDEITEDLDSGSSSFGEEPAAEGELADGFSLIRDGDEFRFELDADDAGLGEGSSLSPSTTDASEGEEGDIPDGFEDALSDLGEGFGEIEAEAVIGLTLPGKILEHNADEKDGSRLTWRLTPGESRTLTAVSDSSQPSDGGGGTPVVPILVGLGVVGVVVGAWLSRRGQKEGLEPAPMAEDSSVLGPSLDPAPLGTTDELPQPPLPPPPPPPPPPSPD